MEAPTSSTASSTAVVTDGLEVEQIDDRHELRDFLVRDKLENAYLLGDLDPDYYEFCRWFGTRSDEELESVLVNYTGLSLPAVLGVGSVSGLDRILSNCRDCLPDRFHFHVKPPHGSTLDNHFQVSNVRRMQRMGLHRSHYQSPGRDSRVRRLGHRDTAAIMELYEHYPDNLFEPSQLETGLYFGIEDDDGHLASIAGVHVCSERYDIAAIGNLVTRPNARGQGLATACTARLLDEVFERVSLVALNVREDNAPAISVYTSFGFQKNTTFLEGRALDPDAHDD